GVGPRSLRITGPLGPSPHPFPRNYPVPLLPAAVAGADTSSCPIAVVNAMRPAFPLRGCLDHTNRTRWPARAGLSQQGTGSSRIRAGSPNPSAPTRNEENSMRLFSNRPAALTRRASLQMEQLETRLVPATQAFFAGGVLSVFGDITDNNIS